MIQMKELAKSVRNIEGIEIDASIDGITFCMEEGTLKEFLKFYEGADYFDYEINTNLPKGIVAAECSILTYFNGSLISNGFYTFLFDFNPLTGALTIKEEEE